MKVMAKKKEFTHRLNSMWQVTKYALLSTKYRGRPFVSNCYRY